MSNERFMAGTKYDGGKPPMDLIPWEAMTGVAQVLDFGRVKYSANNWRGGFEWCRLTGACLRHVFAWLSGQDLDPESGLSHIDHAICCLMFLTAHIKSGLGKDDRYKAPQRQVAAPTPPASRFVIEWNLPSGWTRYPDGMYYDTLSEAEADFPISVANGSARVMEIDRA